MCGRFALAVELIDLPQCFNETAINVDEQQHQIERIDDTHFVSVMGADSNENNDTEDLTREKYRSIIEIELNYPQAKTFRPSYNIPPTGTSVIVYQAKPSNDQVHYRYVIESSTFGLVPSWAKPTDPEPVQRDGKPGPPYSKELQRHEGRQFNCRKESLGKGNALPTWNSHKRKTRCVVPIQGYFEWQKTKTDKIPHFVHSTKSSIIYLAGLYSHNRNYPLENPKDEYFSSFSIVTGPARHEDSKDLAWLHGRKPMMLVPGSKEWYEWLDPTKDWDDSLLDTVLDTVNNKAFHDIEAYTVGRSVGNTTSEGEQLLKRENYQSQKSITSFFQKSPTKRPHVTEEMKSELNKRPKLKVKKEESDIFSALRKQSVKKET
ncbi:hypothetical protein CAAN1_06S03620 [[Candida] anglica]|uniref:DUF159-domain-containing protein n=1 Tax=[Candida] anglica TaxID=148631 RepID=A0ABP0EQG4_9ASCO